MGFGKQILDQFVAVIAFITVISHHLHHTFNSPMTSGACVDL